MVSVAFLIVYHRPADARRYCQLTFDAMYHVTYRDRSHSMAPAQSLPSVLLRLSGTGTCSSNTIHNHTIISTNHFTAVHKTQDTTPDMISNGIRCAI